MDFKSVKRIEETLSSVSRNPFVIAIIIDVEKDPLEYNDGCKLHFFSDTRRVDWSLRRRGELFQRIVVPC
jgi:hypothetical protein